MEVVLAGCDITGAISTPAGSCVALVGAGGKTTSMFAMARELQFAGLRVLVTTTTRIWAPTDAPLVCAAQTSNLLESLGRHFASAPSVALGDHVAADGKLHGVSPELVREIIEFGVCDVVLCEADGAAGRSLKAYRSDEPVIPGCASHVFVLSGVDAVAQRATPALIYRLELFCQANGLAPGERIGPSHVASGLIALARPCPATAQVVYALNKVDDEKSSGAARDVLVELKRPGLGRDVLLLSRGRVVSHYPAAGPRTYVSAS